MFYVGKTTSYAAIRALEHIYREGYSYKKSGVILTDIKGILQVGRDMFGGLRKK